MNRPAAVAAAAAALLVGVAGPVWAVDPLVPVSPVAPIRQAGDPTRPDPQSDAYRAYLLGDVAAHHTRDGRTTVGVAVGAYNAAVVKAAPGDPVVDVGFDCNGGAKTAPDPDLLTGKSYFKGVPLPTGATAAAGTDGALSIYNPATDTLWEFWQARISGGRMTACAGGRIDHVSTSTGAFPSPYGVSASGLAFAPLVVSIAEADALTIDHPVYMALSDTAPGRFVGEATRTDGWQGVIPEGQRVMLDPAVDVDALPMNPLGKAIARAAQTYGFVVADKTSAGINVGVEGDYQQPGAWDRVMRDRAGGAAAWAVLEGFPWERTVFPEPGAVKAAPAPTATASATPTAPAPTVTPTATPTPTPTASSSAPIWPGRWVWVPAATPSTTSTTAPSAPSVPAPTPTVTQTVPSVPVPLPTTAPSLPPRVAPAPLPTVVQPSPLSGPAVWPWDARP